MKYILICKNSYLYFFILLLLIDPFFFFSWGLRKTLYGFFHIWWVCCSEVLFTFMKLTCPFTPASVHPPLQPSAPLRPVTTSLVPDNRLQWKTPEDQHKPHLTQNRDEIEREWHERKRMKRHVTIWKDKVIINDIGEEERVHWGERQR